MYVLYFEYRDRWVYVEYIEESWHSVEMLREINFGKIRKLNIKFKKPWRIEGYTVWILNNFLQSKFFINWKNWKPFKQLCIPKTADSGKEINSTKLTVCNITVCWKTKLGN